MKPQLFSMCGKLVGHYPVASWLHVTSMLHEISCQETALNSFAGLVAIKRLKDVRTKLNADDLIRGVWVRVRCMM